MQPSDKSLAGLKSDTVRLAAYRLAGKTFALTVLGYRVTTVSLCAALDEYNLAAGLHVHGHQSPPVNELTEVMAEWAGDLSGLLSDIRPPFGPYPGFSSVNPELMKEFLCFSEQGVSVIVALAEQLVVSGKLEEIDVYRVIQDNLSRKAS